jgi:hypothetical protein
MIGMIRVGHKTWRRDADARNKFISLLKQKGGYKYTTMI